MIVSNGGERFGLTFNTGDWLVAGDGVWQKVDNSDAVTSVNGKIGNVILTSNDISHNNETVASAIESKQDKLTAGKNITIKNDVISAEFNTAIIDYNLTYNKQSINGVELINAKTLEDFDIQRTIKAGENVYLTQSEANKMSDTVNVYDASETRKGVSEIATQEEVNIDTDDLQNRLGICVFSLDSWYFDDELCRRTLKDHFHVGSLEGLGVGDYDCGIIAAGALLLYFFENQKSAL